MVESGGSGQPRSGNDGSAEHHAGPPAPAADPARPEDTSRDDTPRDDARHPETDGPDTAGEPDTDAEAFTPQTEEQQPTDPAHPGAEPGPDGRPWR